MKKILIRYGEISLKGKNREKFINKLISNITKKLSSIDNTFVKFVHGRIFVDYMEKDEEPVYNIIKSVFGIVSFSEVIETELDLEKIQFEACNLMKKLTADSKDVTFKVESRRSNKGFKYKSPEISKIVGGYVLKNVENLKVDVKTPDIVLEVEVRNRAYVFAGANKCLGGMPYGTCGNGLLLLSGGIDSPVSAYMMAKRGMKLEAVHFYSYPYTSDRAKEKVLDLAKILCNYIDDIDINLVNLAKIQEEIHEKCPDRFMTILSRRFMVKIANKIAKENGLNALVTGESLGQVASQTIEGISVTTDASNIPILRPLIAFDKIDIIKISKEIGCFETSILPFEDCCTVFLPEKVATRPKINDVIDAESLLDVDILVESAYKNREIIKIKTGENIDDLESML
ncbi:MAG: tRNA 4-thiouridine(8) synthase ThiI [Clostridiales bacterium]|nr:MAG: tRNA 4-thiouridine(8) synthase ThiI [Clostridiales bacterium]